MGFRTGLEPLARAPVPLAHEKAGHRRFYLLGIPCGCNRIWYWPCGKRPSGVTHRGITAVLAAAIRDRSSPDRTFMAGAGSLVLSLLFCR